jgi:hypothetical protein
VGQDRRKALSKLDSLPHNQQIEVRRCCHLLALHQEVFQSSDEGGNEREFAQAFF